MRIYCCRLSWRLTASVAWQRLVGADDAPNEIHVLDGWAGWVAVAAVRCLTLVGCRVVAPDFFAGHLKTATGEAVRPAARKDAFVLARHAAEIVVQSSPLLASVDAYWGRHTVRLALAKRLWPAAEALMLRVHAANALARQDDSPARLVVSWPDCLPAESAPLVPSGISLTVGGRIPAEWRAGRAAAMTVVARDLFLRFVHSPPPAPPAAERSLLVLEEDELSMDRSVRSQPHWLADERMPFHTLVLSVTGMAPTPGASADLTAAGVTVVPSSALAAPRPGTETAKKLTTHVRELLVQAWFDRRPSTVLAAASTARLLWLAQRLSTFCASHNVRAFMTCENYTAHADAMSVIGESQGIRTLSYQYSTMPYASLAMATTADTLVTFSPAFHSRFVQPGFPPPRFIDAGYVFGSSFHLLQTRAGRLREQLAAAGATFVLGFFDESVQQDRYGLVSVEDYETELCSLLQWLGQDPTLGVIVKTQFVAHQRLLSPATLAAVAAAKATGRLVMPVSGRHRNTVFPAEVAFASDVTVGHAIGGTASLEAALTGCRSLILNPYALRSDADDMLAAHDIVYASWKDARRAIESFRAGEAAHRALGDWGALCSVYDPFQDGKSAARMRELLMDVLAA